MTTFMRHKRQWWYQLTNNQLDPWPQNIHYICYLCWPNSTFSSRIVDVTTRNIVYHCNQWYMFDILCLLPHSPSHCMLVEGCCSIAFEPSNHRRMKRYNFANSAKLTNLHSLQQQPYKCSHSSCITTKSAWYVHNIGIKLIYAANTVAMLHYKWKKQEQCKICLMYKPKLLDSWYKFR